MAATVESVFRLLDRASPVLDKIDRKATALDRKLDKLNRKVISPEIKLKGMDKADKSLDAFAVKLDEIAAKSPTVTVTVDTKHARAELATLAAEVRAFARMRGTATASVNTRGGGSLTGGGASSTINRARRGGILGAIGSIPFLGRPLAGIAGLAEKAVGSLGTVITKAGTALGGFADGAQRAGGLVLQMGDSAAQTGGVFAKFGGQIAQVGGQISSMATEIGGPVGLVAALGAIIAVGGTALAAVDALAGGITALAASLTAAVGGAALVGGGLLGAFVVGIGSIVAIVKPALKPLKDYTKAMDALKKAQMSGNQTAIKKAEQNLNAMGKANPGIAKLATGLKAIQGEWQKLTKPGQKAFFSVAGEGMETIRKILPTLARLANTNFKAFGDAIKRYVLPYLRSKEFRSFLATFSRAFRDFIGPTIRGLRDFGRGIGNLIKAALPGTNRLVKGFSGFAHSFAELTKTRGAQQFVRGLVSSFEKWWGLIKSIGRVLGALFAPAKRTGDSMVGDLTKTLNGWADWLNKHPREVRKFFRDAADLVSKVVDALAKVLKYLFQLGNSPAFRTLLAMSAKWLGIMFDLASKTSLLVQPISGISRGFSGVFSVIKDIVGAIKTIPGPLKDLMDLLPGDHTVKGGGTLVPTPKRGPARPSAIPGVRAARGALPPAADALKGLGGRTVTRLLDARNPVRAATTTRAQVSHVFTLLARDIQQSWLRMTNSIRTRLLTITSIFRNQTRNQRDVTTIAYRAIRDRSSNAVESMAKQIDAALQKLNGSFTKWTGTMVATVRTNFQAIVAEMNSALKAMGVTPKQAGVSAIPGVGASAAAKPSTKKKAAGGRIQGSGLSDSVMVAPGNMAAPGELIVNRHTEGRVNRMLGGRTTLGREVAGESKPHWQSFAKGGRRGKSVWDDILPDSGVSRDKALEEMSAKIKKAHARGGRVAGDSFTAMVRKANAIDARHFPYRWGGGHDPSMRGPYDCSGAVSAVLAAGGFMRGPETSGTLSHMFERGPGDVTIFANAGHTYMRLGSRYFGTSGQNPGGGAGYFAGSPRPGFAVRHVGARGKLGSIPGVGAVAVHEMRKRRAGGVGMFHTGAQAAVDAVRAGAQSVLGGAAGSAGGGGAGGALLPAGRGRTVGASTFGGPGDPGTGSTGYRGDNLNQKWNSFAELGMGKALGGLPYMAGLRVTGPKGSLKLYKRDIGAGGGPVGKYDRGIDLWYKAAQRLGVSGLAPVKISKAAQGGRVADWGGWHASGGRVSADRPTYIGIGDGASRETAHITRDRVGGGKKKSGIHVEHLVVHGGEQVKDEVVKAFHQLARELDLQGTEEEVV